MSPKLLIASLIGLSAGLAVGIGFVAFITVLGLIPRLMQLTRTQSMVPHYELAVALGVIGGSFFSLLEPAPGILPPFLMAFSGLFYGAFVGMLAAALTEVLDVIPITAKRIGMEEKLLYLLMTMVIGKMAGALFHWVYFVDF
jgi:hypothetical protein